MHALVSMHYRYLQRLHYRYLQRLLIICSSTDREIIDPYVTLGLFAPPMFTAIGNFNIQYLFLEQVFFCSMQSLIPLTMLLRKFIDVVYCKMYIKLNNYCYKIDRDFVWRL